MTRTLQNRYVVVTGDLNSSRKLKDRAEVQEELKNALRIVNRRFFYKPKLADRGK